MKTKLFSEWFKIDGKPKNMKEILLSVADKEGVFSSKDMREKLNFGKKEMEGLIESYKAKDLIYRLMGEKDMYAFV